MDDIIIIGGGPAGLTAGIFACRAGMKVKIFEKLVVGGQANLSAKVANFPGYEEVDGYELSARMKQQVENLGAEIIFEDVKSVRKENGKICVETSNKSYCAKKLIIATGAKERLIGCPGEKEFRGKGVSYCASCDGYFFRDKVVAVVGGGNTAFENVLYLSKIVKKIYLVHRREGFRADKLLVDSVKQLDNVTFVLNECTKDIVGEDKVQRINFCSGLGLDVDAVFVAIGRIPDLDWLNIELEKTNDGYIIVDENMKTSVENVHACGDITNHKLKQIVTACAEGAVAGNSASL